MPFFDTTRYFSNLSNVSHISVESNGGNGIIYILSYKDNKSKAVLKLPRGNFSDNLLYEYMAGKTFINKHLDTGIFVKTYALLLVKTGECNELISDYIDVEYFKKRFTVVTQTGSALLNRMCNCNESFGILTEYIDTKINLYDYILTNNDPVRLLNILLKIYGVLVKLYPNFVHNDLSPGNVLIYNDEPKIIDYGRCYFKGKSISSDSIYEKYVQLSECISGASDSSNGFKGIWNINSKEDFSFMNKDCSNRSTRSGVLKCNTCRDSVDLKLLYEMNDAYREPDSIKLLFERTRPDLGTTTYDLKYEKLSTLCKYNKKGSDYITTIHQVADELTQIHETLLSQGSIARKLHRSRRSTSRRSSITKSKRRTISTASI